MHSIKSEKKLEFLSVNIITVCEAIVIAICVVYLLKPDAQLMHLGFTNH